jgi:hypothetical protein
MAMQVVAHLMFWFLTSVYLCIVTRDLISVQVMQFAGRPFPSSLLDMPLESSPLCHSSRALNNLLWGAILIHLRKS